MTVEGIPRRTVESSPVAELMGLISNLKERVASLERGATLRNASISGGEGLRVLDSAGNTRVSINTTDGAVVAYDENEAPAARFGPLDNSAPGKFGVEVNVNGTWVQLGAQVATWNNLAGKPASFPPSAHSHAGGDITSAVANATNASEASHAALADGSQYAFNNTVSGNTFYAVWVGNDGGFHLGRNTSSIRYKTNVREHYTDPANVLALTPVVYDRKPRTVTDEDGSTREIPGAKDEFGLIAEEVFKTFPELVTWYEGEIDGIRYDLLSVALLNVVKAQEKRIKALETEVASKHSFTPPGLGPVAENVQPGNARTPYTPLPFVIEPQTPEEPNP